MHDEQICGMSVICRFSIFTVGVQKAEGVNSAACVICLNIYNAYSFGSVIANYHGFYSLIFACICSKRKHQPVHCGTFIV